MTLLPDIADQLAQAILEARKAQGPLSREGIAAACRPVIEAYLAERGGAKKPKDAKATTIPPEPDWVTAYSLEIDYPLDGTKWCDTYEAKGWVVSGKSQRMKNWKAAVRNWKASGWGKESKIYTGKGQPKAIDYRYAPEPKGDWRATAKRLLNITELPAHWETWMDFPPEHRAMIAHAHL